MKNRRLCLSCTLLCLPTLAVVALGCFFWFDKVPEIVKGERDRVRGVYREAAEAIRQQPSRFPLATNVNWKAAGKMAPGKWGYELQPEVGQVLVWYGTAAMACTRLVPLEAERDYALMFAVGGIFSLLVLVGVTLIGLKFFWGYNRSRDDFLAATAHDLTTPLVGLRLLLPPGDGDARALVERLLRLVTNIKEFLRLGGRQAPQPTRFDLVQAYREAYALLAADYRDLLGADLPLSLGTDPQSLGTGPGVTAEFSVFADETMTIQVLWNLLGNDLKYAAPFGAVRARIFADGDFTYFELIDEGPGMTAAARRRCFDRYYRAQSVLASGKGGFGIGLCTAKEFVEAMGGRLTVRENYPHGCIFTMALPHGG